jgi:hypothetical protein
MAKTQCKGVFDCLLARGSGRLWFGVRCFKAKNCFAFFHQIKTIARNRFQIADVCIQQVDLAGLARQQTLLLVDLLLEIVDLGSALHQFLVRRNEKAHDNQPDRYDEQNEENPVQSLPEGSFATRAEISVTVLHFSGL